MNWRSQAVQKVKKKKRERETKNIKIINTRKKEVNLLTDDMTVYVKNPKKSTKKLLELGRIINSAKSI